MKRTVSLVGVLAAFVSSQAFAEGANTVTGCHGTEPFWGLTILPEKVIYENVSGEIRTIPNRGAKSAAGQSSHYVALYQGRTSEDSTRFMNVIIKKGQCSDDMSDNDYPYSVLVLSGSELFYGCCP